MCRRKKEEEERKRIEKLKADKIEREKRRIEVENRIALEKKKADLESNETQNRSEIDSKEKADEAEGNFSNFFTWPHVGTILKGSLIHFSNKPFCEDLPE